MVNVTQKDIRNQIKPIRDNLTFSDVIIYSDKIFKNLISLDFLFDYSTFMVYNAFRNEVDLSKFISHLNSLNKTVVYPLTKGNDMIAVKPNSNLTTNGQFGIKEFINYDIISKVDVVILPLIACDNNKNRVGFGKGYYDKFLQNKNAVKIGVCYDFQLVDYIPSNPWDVKLDYIITPTKIIK